MLQVVDDVEDIAGGSSKELQIEEKLSGIVELWDGMTFQFQNFKNRGPVILKPKELGEIMEALEDSQMQLGSMASNRLYLHPVFFNGTNQPLFTGARGGIHGVKQVRFRDFSHGKVISISISGDCRTRGVVTRFPRFSWAGIPLRFAKSCTRGSSRCRLFRILWSSGSLSRTCGFTWKLSSAQATLRNSCPRRLSASRSLSPSLKP